MSEVLRGKAILLVVHMLQHRKEGQAGERKLGVQSIKVVGMDLCFMSE